MRAATKPNQAEATVCGYCGMVCRSIREYHPYAACLMFQACRNGDTVRGNLQSVIEYGKDGGRLDDFRTGS
jgi:hypothetical protein